MVVRRALRSQGGSALLAILVQPLVLPVKEHVAQPRTSDTRLGELRLELHPLHSVILRGLLAVRVADAGVRRGAEQPLCSPRSVSMLLMATEAPWAALKNEALAPSRNGGSKVAT